jgi:hypothetical protein
MANNTAFFTATVMSVTPALNILLAAQIVPPPPVGGLKSVAGS